MKNVAHHTMRWTLLLVFTTLVFIAILTGAARISLPFAGNYRAEIQDYVSGYLGNSVEIGSLDLSWHGVGPRLVLGDIVLVSGAGQEQDLQFEEILLDLDLLRSWINGSWQIKEMSLVGANLSVEHLGDNQFRVYGYQIDPQKQNKNANLDVLGWLTNADSVALLESRVHFVDDARNINLDMQDLNIRAQNLSGLHQIRLDTTLPGITPGIVRISTDFQGSSDNMKESSGKFHFASSNINLKNVAALPAIDSPFTVVGDASLDLWGEWGGGEFQNLRIISSLENFSVRNNQQSRSWNADQLRVDVAVKKENKKLKFAIQELLLGTKADQNDLFAGNLTLNLNDNSFSNTHLHGSHIELHTVASVLSVFEGVEKVDPFLDVVQTIEPKGKLNNWSLSADSDGKSMIKLSAQANLESVSFMPYKKLPGFRDIDGRLTIKENHGEISLSHDSIGFDMPRWFRNGLDIDKLDGSLAFRFDSEGFELQSSRLTLENKHATGEGQFHFLKTRGSPGWLDIDAKLDWGNAEHAKIYYPTGKMNAELVKWMDSAIRQGELTNGFLNIHGPIKGFPYADGSGEFKAGFDVNNGQLKFLPDWPHASLLNATVGFERNSMSINTSRAVIAGNSIPSAQVQIEDLKDPVLHVQGKASGDSQDFLTLVDSSPLQSILEPVIGNSTISGPVSVNLNLDAPLIGFSPDKLEFVGDLGFSGNRWKSDSFGFDLKDIQGELVFTQDSLTTDGLLANYLGRSIAVTADTVEQSPNVFSKISIKGELAAGDILKSYDIPLDHWFSGESVWNLDLVASRLQDENTGMSIAINATSDLLGTTVNLPTSFDKSSNEKTSFGVNAGFHPADQNTIWHINYGNDIIGKVRIPKDSSELDALLVGFGEALPSDNVIKPGIFVIGDLPVLSFDGWVSTISDVIDRFPESKTHTPIMPVEALLSTKNLLVGKVNTGPARIRGGSDNESVITGIASRWLSGDLRYPREYWDKEKPLRANFSFLDKQFLDAMSTSDGDGERLNPEFLPSMEVSIRKFVWDDIQVEDMSLSSVPVTSGLDVVSLGFMHEHLQMKGNAEWRLAQESEDAEESVHSAKVSFQLSSDNAGNGLGRIGIGDAFAEGAGQIDVSLDWDDALYAPAFDKLRGEIKIVLTDGRILAVEPGAAKILGLFALQAVPRRLLLDFEDLTKEGLRYDKIDAGISIENGIAETQYMQMQGPIGVVFSSGSTDFISNTYDQKITVLPRLTATLPIIGLLSAGATAGVGVLVIDQVLKGLGINFDEIGKREYRLTGSWDEPLIERIITPAHERISGDDR